MIKSSTYQIGRSAKKVMKKMMFSRRRVRRSPATKSIARETDLISKLSNLILSVILNVHCHSLYSVFSFIVFSVVRSYLHCSYIYLS